MISKIIHSQSHLIFRYHPTKLVKVYYEVKNYFLNDHFIEKTNFLSSFIFKKIKHCLEKCLKLTTLMSPITKKSQPFVTHIRKTEIKILHDYDEMMLSQSFHRMQMVYQISSRIHTG
jgi:hypothetical protein